MIYIVAIVALVGLGLLLRSHLRAPSHRYEGLASVSEVYDRWTNDHILEYYWDEHLHAGHYGNPPVKKDFIQAKAVGLGLNERNNLCAMTKPSAKDCASTA